MQSVASIVITNLLELLCCVSIWAHARAGWPYASMIFTARETREAKSGLPKLLPVRDPEKGTEWKKGSHCSVQRIHELIRVSISSRCTYLVSTQYLHERSMLANYSLTNQPTNNGSCVSWGTHEPLSPLSIFNLIERLHSEPWTKV